MEGGVGAFTQELARALHGAGHEVHVITSRDARPEESGRSLSGTKEADDLGFAQLHARIGRWRWPSLAVVADITLRQELDVVNLQYQSAAFNMNSGAINFLPWRLKHVTTTVVTFHDLRVPFLFPKAGPLRSRAVLSLARQAHGVIATNSVDFTRLEDMTSRPVTKIAIGSNVQARYPNQIEIAEVRSQLGLEEGDVLLGYFGFLNESKGADTLLKALALLGGNYHLVFIGGQTGASDATNEAFLALVRNLSKSLGLENRVHWTGFLSDERVGAHLVTATAVVLPYKDGVSLRRGTLMAALAYGCPVITTTPQCQEPELQAGEGIWVTPPDDPEQLAAAIRAVCSDMVLRENLSSGARRLAALFSWEKIAEQTLHFYRQLSKDGSQ